jgi:hypothetical protein
MQSDHVIRVANGRQVVGGIPAQQQVNKGLQGLIQPCGQAKLLQTEVELVLGERRECHV